MAITDNAQGNVHRFPQSGAKQEALVSRDTDVENQLDNQRYEIHSIICLLELIAREKKHVAERAWLSDKLETAIGFIEGALANAVAVRAPNSSFVGSRAAPRCHVDADLRACLRNFSAAIGILDEMIHEDRHDDSRVSLIAYMKEEYARLDDNLLDVMLQPQAIAH
jgi:hypothetical protein